MRVLVENTLADKAGQKILTKYEFDEFISMEKSTQVFLFKCIGNIKNFKAFLPPKISELFSLYVLF
jgi:hypothetical protein